MTFRTVHLPGLGIVQVYPRPNHESIALDITRFPGVRLVSLELMPEHVLELGRALELVALDALAAEAVALVDALDAEELPEIELMPDAAIVARALTEAESRLMDGNR